MGVICGIIGKRNAEVVKAMASAMAHRGECVHRAEGPNFAVASSSEMGKPPVLIDGRPRDLENSPLSPGQLKQHCNKQKKGGAIQVRGSFAAVVRRGSTKEWWLMRDRMGIKPLYYCVGPDYLLFSSEMKGLLASGLVPKHLDLLSVDRYLTMRCVPSPHSIIQGVRRVRPGHVVSYKNGRCTETSFAGFAIAPEPTTREDAADALAHFLRQGAAARPTDGLLWSAGIDCTALAAFAHPKMLVHVVLDAAWQDERRPARESARRMGLPLQVSEHRRLTESAFLKAVGCLDEPIADPSIIPLWFIIQEASKWAGTFMSGHGADELLGGYPRYNFWNRAKGGAQDFIPVNLLTGLLPALPPNAFIRRASRYLTSIRDDAQAYLSLLSVFDDEERESLYTEAMKAVIYEHGGSLSLLKEHFREDDLTRSQLSLDLNIGLPDVTLTELDRISAAHGISIRLPYLDDGVVDFALTLPPEVKFGVRSKPVLRLAMKGLVPGTIRQRARRGFAMPQEGRAMGVIQKLAQDTITQDRVESVGIFKWRPVERILNSYTHNIYRRRQFWSLLMFFAWYRQVMES